ncbi:cytochrome P450 [Stipitochalara longipes BDJ]|nr:cytochrome P450 [Stipitochalara longipes BDJ]
MSINDALSFLFRGYAPSIVLAVLGVLLIIRQRLAIKLDPQEPPVLKPRIPYIGHIIGLLQYHGAYFDKLYARKPLPAATLPMINGKLYVINDPIMAQAAFRHKNLSFDPFTLAFAQRMLSVSDETMVPIRFAGDEKTPSFLHEFVKELHGAMAEKYLNKMNANALERVSATVNDFGKTFKTDSLYYWLRTMMTLATSDALFGSHNPLRLDESLVDSIWDFDGDLLGILLNIYPSVTFPKAFQARANIQAALIKYYSAKHDLEPDVSQMTKARAAVLRKHNVPDADIGRFELALLHVSTANAIPTFFWQLCFIASDPSTTALVRQELDSIITLTPLSNGQREAVIDITKLETHCPILVSTYRETIRLANAQAGSRRVMADTLLSDGKRDYLLLAGCDVQIPAGVPHLNPSAWGSDASSFDAKRFLTPEERGDNSAKARTEDREQKKSYFPFGGGKHLCPGRNFAFAEILGAVAVLVAGFEVTDGESERIRVPVLGRGRLGDAIAKPKGAGLEMGAKITRRKGWEDVVWRFSC